VAINKAFSWNKGFREYFAVKALPNPIILQILKEEGCGVDCSSLTELMLSEACGFTGSDIMFSSNQTPVEDMKKAYELGAYINLDDATMVDFLDRVAGIPENIFCRYNPGGTFQLGESEEGFQVMDKPGDAKYGMTEEQMIDSYKKLMAKGAKNFGIHAFLASNTISDAYYPELAGILFQLAVRVQKATGAHIGYINLSGGVGIPYRPDQTENDIMAIGEGVRRKFEEILVPAGMGDVAIFTEMGRFTTGPYGALVATAIHEKHIYKEYIGLDACAANLMRPAMYGENISHLAGFQGDSVVVALEQGLHGRQEVQRCKVITGGLGAADEAVRAVLAEQDLGAAELAVVVVAHGGTVGTGVVLKAGLIMALIGALDALVSLSGALYVLLSSARGA